MFAYNPIDYVDVTPSDKMLSAFQEAKTILLITTSRGLIIFGSILYEINFRFIKYNSENQDISFFAYATFYNNKHEIGFNVDLLEKRGLDTVDDFVYILIHEMLHIILRHSDSVSSSSRLLNYMNGYSNINPQVLRTIIAYAIDHVVNEYIMKHIQLNLNQSNFSKNGLLIYFDELLGKFLTVEEVIDYIISNTKIEDNGDLKSYIFSSEIANKQSTIKFEEVNYSDVHMSSESGSSNEEMKIKQMLNNMSSVLSSIQKKISSDLYEILKKLTDIRINWESLLQRVINKNSPDLSTEYSWKRLNKKYQSHNIHLQGKSLSVSEMIPKTLVCVVDTSGSVDSESLSKFMSIIYDSSSRFEEIQIVYHDSKIKEIKKYEKDNMDASEILKVKGRGCTSHKDSFEYIEKLFIKNINELSLVIIFSDFMSDIEKISSDFTFLKYVPIQIVSNTKLSDNMLNILNNSTPIYIK